MDHHLDWDGALAFLGHQDPELATLFPRFNDVRLSKAGDAFKAMANAIVGQQISVKAADAIWKRLLTLARGEGATGDLLPQNILALGSQELLACGLSTRKVDYLQGLAQAWVQGLVDPRVWPDMEDSVIVKQLCSLKGIGPWTADMVLIFVLNRPDVLPLTDIALVRAGAQHFGWDSSAKAAKEAAKLLETRAQGWRPYRTVASWYLWRTQDAEPVSY